MQKNKITFLIPVYPPHFKYLDDFLLSFKRYGFEGQAEVCVIFTNEEECERYGTPSFNFLILPEELRVFENKGIINIKKLWGLWQIRNKYEYVIVCDSETLLLKNVDLAQICTNYFKNKILLGNHALEDICSTVRENCKKFFTKHKDLSKLENQLYLWFNQPCIYKGNTIEPFFKYTGIYELLSSLSFYDFDYYIYMYYLILEKGFKIKDLEISSPIGTLEGTRNKELLSRELTANNLILLASEQVLPEVDNPFLFMLIHTDRSRERKILIHSEEIAKINKINTKLSNDIAKTNIKLTETIAKINGEIINLNKAAVSIEKKLLNLENRIFALENKKSAFYKFIHLYWLRGKK
ncbi:hypothetical protein Dip510_001910 [Elusimicrobium posterum]|uniref:hypothetical protein n=1 Tax=Elusimicrobium posterum TaxID=3116653 RepID=UPI003C75BE74